MHHRSAVRVMVFVATAAALAGCDPTGPEKGGPPPDDSTFATSCAEQGPSHSGPVSGTWGAFDGPHHVTATIQVETPLEIAPGALICLAEGAEIQIPLDSRITALGRGDAPIVFTAADPTRPWGGILATSASLGLRHVRIEHAAVGVSGSVRAMGMDSSVIRETQGPALDLEGGASGAVGVHNTLIDRSCLAGGAAAVEQGSYTELVLENVLIRDAGCGGISTARRASQWLEDVRIEGCAGIGLKHSWAMGGGPWLEEVSGLRITGCTLQPALVSGGTAASILAAIPPDSLSGNGIDRIVVFGSTGDIHVTPELGWELGWRDDTPPGVRVDLYVGSTVSMEPGSELRLNAVHYLDGFRLAAAGTAEAPISIQGYPGSWTGLVVGGETTDTSRLSHAALDRVVLESRDEHALIASDLTATSGFVRLAAPGSSIRRAVIRDADIYQPDRAFAGLVLAGEGTTAEDVTVRGSAGNGILSTGSDATISGCEVTGSALDAVWVANQATGVSVHDCNLDGNDGVGLRNTAPGPVDARFNWWGDPVGPTGPAGAGVSGPVDVDPWLTAPAGDSALAISCDQPGPTHSGDAGGFWGAYGGPHHVTGVTVQDSLVIEAGARVCMTEGATIQVYSGARLVARGTVDAPIVFTAQDSTRPWGGFSHTRARYDQVVLSIEHARIEHASRGIVGAGIVEVDSSVIRAITGPAVRATYGAYDGQARIRSTLIDDACQGKGVAAVEQEVFGRVELEDVVIRDSGCGGIWAERKSSLALSRVRIEGSAGIGLEHETIGGRVFMDVDGLRITGGGDRPARVSGENAVAILGSVPPDSLAGNAVDRLAVFGVIPGALRANAAVGLELGWVGTDLARAEFYDDLVLEPGAEVLVNRADFHPGFRLLAEGTADAPIRIHPPADEWEGIIMGGEAGDTSRIAHVILDRIHLRSRETHTVVASALSVTRGSLWLGSPGSTLRNATIEDGDTAAAGAAPAALFVSAPGIAMEDVTIHGADDDGLLVTGSDVALDGCEITGGNGDAIWVANQAADVSVHGCNLAGNGGLGLRNTADAQVDAEQNWWGDPAGPAGPDGAGVSGNVDFDLWLTEPPIP